MKDSEKTIEQLLAEIDIDVKESKTDKEMIDDGKTIEQLLAEIDSDVKESMSKADKERVFNALSKDRQYLSDLRRQFSDISRDQFDNIMIELQDEEKIALYDMDDVHNITKDIDNGAIILPWNGAKRHVVYGI